MANLTLFSQIISKLDRNKFAKLVKEKQTDKHQKGKIVGRIWYRCYSVSLLKASRFLTFATVCDRLRAI